MNLKFISLNCNGLRSKHKRRAIFSFLKKERINIACLQETFITPADFDMWKREWGGEMSFTPGSHHSQGLITLLSRNLDVTSIITQRIGERILSLSLSYNEHDITVLNVYGPNNDKDKQEFLTELEKYLQHLHESKYVFVAGDFNMVLNNDIDVISGNPHDSKIVSRFNEFMCSTDMYDVWRLYNGNTREFTWSSSSAPWKARRLDYLLVNDSMFDKVTECDIIPVSNTDHRAVTMTMSIGKIKRGPGYWKFNQSLLKDQDYVKIITNKITNCKLALESFPAQVKWDYCKSNIKECSIIYSKEKALQRKNAMADIRNKLKSLQSVISNYDKERINTPKEELINEMKDTKLPLYMRPRGLKLEQE